MAGLFNWGGRKADTETVAPPPPRRRPPAPTERSTKVLPRFLAALTPVRVAGPSEPRTGRRTEHRVFRRAAGLQDLRRRPRRGSRGRAAACRARSGHSSKSGFRTQQGSIDGILCWDLFDWLDRPTSQALAAHLARLLKPGGVLYAFFGATAAPITHYTRYIVAGPDSFELRTSPAPPKAAKRARHPGYQ